MSELDTMSEADLNQALQNEIQALNGGINPSNNEFQEEESQEDENQDDYEQDESEQEEDESDRKENKTEKKIKKLLSQRNEERKEKEGLSERLERLENELADTKFYKENQEAFNYKNEIDSLIQERWFTRDEAYLLIAWKQVLEQNKKLSSNKNSMIGNTPWINKNWINPKDMWLDDLDNLVKWMYNAGKLTI